MRGSAEERRISGNYKFSPDSIYNVGIQTKCTLGRRRTVAVDESKKEKKHSIYIFTLCPLNKLLSCLYVVAISIISIFISKK